jgi:DNA-binding transcriptional LysR family regulator
VAGVESGALDAGLLSPPERLPRGLLATHRFDDAFAFIAPPESGIEASAARVSFRSLKKQLRDQRWLALRRDDPTGAALHRWLADQGLHVEPVMELDSFDVIVNLVSLGLGVSLAPQRVLALYGNRRKYQRVETKPRFTRQLAVVRRKTAKVPAPLAQFIAEVLF